MAAESDSSVSSDGAGRQRSTRPFAAVREVLAQGGDFRSAQDIHAALRGNGEKVGLATVYRTLTSLAQMIRTGRVRSVDTLRSEGSGRESMAVDVPALRVDDRRYPCLLVTHEVRGMREAIQVELLENHGCAPV